MATVAVYLLLSTVVLGITVHRLHGSFSYSLDDAYIHLSLAQQMLHGHYGINVGEPTSPASSILWPLLLLPFSRMPLHTWVPLLWNVLFGSMGCLLLGRILERIRPSNRGTARAGSALLVGVAATLAVVDANLVGLTFLGMEHTLQMLLVLGCFWGLVEASEGRPVPGWVLAMAAVAPAIRYEDLAFTLGVALLCLAQGRRRAGVATFVASLLPLLVFGLFLHGLGLPPLPSSVLVKGGLAGGAHGGATLPRLLGLAAVNSLHHDGQARTLTPALLVLLSALYAERAHPVFRRALLCGFVAVALRYLLGPFGWFYRYDTALRTFLLLLCLLFLRRHGRAGMAVAALLLLGWTSFYLRPLRQTSDACVSIARQQFQMHRFEHEFWRGSVAVNDLGWVALDHPDAAYVLDLDGLASPESARQQIKDASWLRSEVQKHGVGLAMVYSNKFESIPTEWVHLGTLTQRPLRFATVGQLNVDFYATSPASTPALRAQVAAFRRTLPPEVTLR